MDVLKFIADVGPTTGLIVMTVLYLLKHFDRRSKVAARAEHERLDDTETLREFAKEDRDLLRDIQKGNRELTGKNIEMAQEIGDLKVVAEDFQNQLEHCREGHRRLQEEIEELKAAVRELRDAGIAKDETIKIQAAIIKQLRAG